MLKKFVRIKNVGTFRDAKAKGNVELKRLTLIHAGNGRGKTTLGAILRSLRTGDPNYLKERSTIDGDGVIAVDILTDGTNAVFANGAWNKTAPEIEIFDHTFVSQNVYSGDVIDHEHKKNLCRIVIGAEGVALAEKFDSLDAELRAATASVTTQTEAVQKAVPVGTSLEAFIALPNDPQIAEKIEAKKLELKVIADAAAIKKRPNLTPMNLLDFRQRFVEILGKTVDNVSADAERLVNEHIRHHGMGARGQPWLAEGVGFGEKPDCPFCAQPLAQSNLMTNLRSFFSSAYRAFQREVTGLLALHTSSFGDAAAANVQRVLEVNAAAVEFWGQYLRIQLAAVSYPDQIEPVFHQARSQLRPLCERKMATPLERIEIAGEAKQAFERLNGLSDLITKYNASVAAYNVGIAQLKASTDVKSADLLAAELKKLEAQKARHEAASAAIVSSLETAQRKKEEVVAKKEEARTQLEAYNKTVIERYKDAVNKLLNRFGAAFSLGTVEVQYVGRTPRAAYTFLLRGKEIDPGGESTPPGVPCFGNMLSAGDRTTLALAFFIAQIQSRGDRDKLVVVLDDPFSSMDTFRQAWTVHSIQELADTVQQVAVLSHSLSFLQELTERFPKADQMLLKIERSGRMDSTIAPLDLELAVASGHEKDIIQLRKYCEGLDGDERKTVRSIRPVLEHHFRTQAPDECPAGNGWLGDFLGQVKIAPNGSALDVFKADFTDFDHLNSYTAPFAHDSAQEPAIDTDELRKASELALQLIGRYQA